MLFKWFLKFIFLVNLGHSVCLTFGRCSFLRPLCLAGDSGPLADSLGDQHSCSSLTSPITFSGPCGATTHSRGRSPVPGPRGSSALPPCPGHCPSSPARLDLPRPSPHRWEGPEATSGSPVHLPHPTPPAVLRAAPGSHVHPFHRETALSPRETSYMVCVSV